MTPKIHAAAGATAMLAIATFWTSSLISELFAGRETIAFVKTAILWGMLILVPALALTGASGSKLGKGWRLPLVTRKSRRMRWIALNGLVILLPSAVFLAARAQAGLLDTTFFVVQSVELAAGAVNFSLMALNMKDGLSIRKRKMASA